MKNAPIQASGERLERNPAPMLLGSAGAKENGKGEWHAGREVYWSHRRPVDLYSFDDDYLRRLGAHDPATEDHFVSYFSERLKITLRARGIDSHTIEDVRQETFCRVWVAVRAGAVNNPRGFGSYVHSVCKNVLSESRRVDFRNQHDSLESTDVADGQLGLEELMQQSENTELVGKVMAKLPQRDRNILHARFFEELDSDEVCEQFAVDRDYVRVLLHRAILKFGELYKQKSN